LPIRSIECRQITADIRFDFFHSPFSLALVKLRSPLLTAPNTAIDGDQNFSKQSQLLTQHNELATDASDGLAVVFSAVSDGLEVGYQPPGQSHQLDVALGFSLQASSRLSAVEIVVDVDLQQGRGVVSMSATIGWNGTVKTQIDQVEFVDKDVHYTYRIRIADAVVEALGK